MENMNKLIFQMGFPGIYVDEVQCIKDLSMPKRHMHVTTEIYFMVKGERYYFIEQDTFHVKPNMVVLINPHQIHKTNIVNGDGYHRFLLQLEPSIVDLYFKVSGNNDLLKKPYDVVELSNEDWQAVLSTFESLKTEMLRENMQDHTMSRLILMQLITLFMRAQKKEDVAFYNQQIPDRIVHTNMHDIVHKIVHYIQNHFSEECSLDEIAAHFFISRSYLTRIFKSITGFTVNEYLNLCRVRNAKTLLNTTELSITEISDRSGFGNITNFEKNFKTITNMTPSQFRNQQ